LAAVRRAVARPNDGLEQLASENSDALRRGLSKRPPFHDF
jgi:hypothetical protein